MSRDTDPAAQIAKAIVRAYTRLEGCSASSTTIEDDLAAEVRKALERHAQRAATT